MMPKFVGPQRNTPMLRRTIFAGLIAVIAALGVYGWLTAPTALALPAPTRGPDLANGKELFNTGGCSSCHAVPNQPDRLRLGGGLPLGSPFGTFYAPNISP